MIKNDDSDLILSLKGTLGSCLSIEIWYEGEVWIFRPLGKIDGTTSPEFETTIIEGINQGMRKIVIDCSDMSYISSAGLRVLILTVKRLQPLKGELKMAAMNQNVHEVLTMSGFLKFVPEYPDTTQAIQSFTPES